MKTKHTPIPWEIGIENNGADHINVWMGIVHIASVMKFIPTGESAMANAEFITRACNSHYDLLESLENYHHFITNTLGYNDDDPMIGSAKSAIAKAKGESSATINDESELLDALELALEVIQATGPGSYPEAEETIKSVIAKAKGEKP